MKQIILASNNPNKLREIQALGIEQIALPGPGLPQPKEDGGSFKNNAAIKAIAAHFWCGQPTVADDSGLIRG